VRKSYTSVSVEISVYDQLKEMVKKFEEKVGEKVSVSSTIQALIDTYKTAEEYEKTHAENSSEKSLRNDATYSVFDSVLSGASSVGNPNTSEILVSD
jgi:hypothetical protein